MTSAMINFFAKHYEARRYLEIGVRDGETFFAVSMPYKVAVDPCFRFDPVARAQKSQHFFPITSDEFFCQLATAGSSVEAALCTHGVSVLFDVIFIDGLHTFEQSWRDFTNCLPYAHKNTLFILDDTVPCDPYSSIPDQQRSLNYRRKAGLEGGYWHGDVFKTVFAIHDCYPEFSYCTLMGGANPQTVVWRTGNTCRAPAFSGIEEIARLEYFGMLQHAHLLMPVKAPLAAFIGKTLTPQEYAQPDDWEKLFYQV